jgi:hypothetical protein
VKMVARWCDVRVSSVQVVSEVGELLGRDGGWVCVNEAECWCRECRRIETM